MTYRVVLTEPAQRELTAAASWWAEHHSLDQAIRWYTLFTKALERLATHPLLHPLARENDRFDAELRGPCISVSAVIRRTAPSIPSPTTLSSCSPSVMPPRTTSRQRIWSSAADHRWGRGNQPA